MRMFAGRMLAMLVNDPTVRDVLRQTEPMIKETANLEYKILVGIAHHLAER